MSNQELDAARAREFAGHFLGLMNGAAIAQLTSIGHQTGLLDTLGRLKPSTSVQIARAAGLNERYVREWLNGMVVGRIVEYAARTGRYSLPAEHAACLPRRRPEEHGHDVVVLPDARYSRAQGDQELPAGGGVPYSAYRGFQKLMAERSAQRQDHLLLSKTLPAVGIVDRLKRGIEVADIGCGSGHAINLMAAAFPNSRFTGYDFAADGIRAARAESRRLKARNTRFEVMDTAQLPDGRRFDFVTAFDAIHDQAEPRRVLANISRLLRDGGLFLMVDTAGTSRVENDMDDPLAIFKYTVSVMHCMTVSLALGGEGLGTMWGKEKALELLKEAGFGKVAVQQIEGDVLNSYYIARKK